MCAREAMGREGPLATFSVAPFDMVEDLCGDPDADLVVFFAGNQYMAVPDLVEGFVAAHPDVRSVFYETLPPGVLLDQFRRGGLQMGSLELRAAPDVLALGPDALDELRSEGLVERCRPYARNDLALLVAAGNPAHVVGWADLGRPGLRVAFPDPRTEGIGRLALGALERSGGPALRHDVEVEKAGRKEVVFTAIHHRQSPAWIIEGVVDVAVVWSTEGRHHRAADSRLDMVSIPARDNRTGTYAASVVTGAPHPEAARAFADHLCGVSGRDVYAAHGFSPFDAA